VSGDRFLLIFAGEPMGWLRLADDRVVARGDYIEAMPPLEADESDLEPAERVVLVVPGSAVAIHWIDLPGDLAPAQARGAARLMASEVSAEPVDKLHVAIGPRFGDEAERCMALTGAPRMEQWLAGMQAIGFDPDHVLPESLLIAPPDDGVRLFKRGGLDNVRGIRRAFAAESELTALLVGEEPIATLDADAFEAGLAAAIAAAPVDLRQGAFAKRRRWAIDWLLIRRLAMIAAGILLVTLLIQFVLIMRYSYAADALEREAQARARDAIPGNVEIVDPALQLREQLEMLGGGAGYGEIAGAIFAAVRETPEAELQSLVYADNAAQITVALPGMVETDAFQQRLAQSGLIVEAGAMRDGGGRRIADYVVRAP